MFNYLADTPGIWKNILVALIDDADFEWLVSLFYCEDFVQKATMPLP